MFDGRREVAKFITVFAGLSLLIRIWMLVLGWTNDLMHENGDGKT